MFKKLEMQQVVVLSTTNPAPVLRCSKRPKTAISLHFQSLDDSTWLSEFQKTTKIHAYRSSRFLVILLTKKQTNKEIDRKQYPVPDTIGGGVIIKNLQSFLIMARRHNQLGTSSTDYNMADRRPAADNHIPGTGRCEQRPRRWACGNGRVRNLACLHTQWCTTVVYSIYTASIHSYVVSTSCNTHQRHAFTSMRTSRKVGDSVRE